MKIESVIFLCLVIEAECEADKNQHHFQITVNSLVALSVALSLSALIVYLYRRWREGMTIARINSAVNRYLHPELKGNLDTNSTIDIKRELEDTVDLEQAPPSANNLQRDFSQNEQLTQEMPTVHTNIYDAFKGNPQMRPRKRMASSVKIHSEKLPVEEVH